MWVPILTPILLSTVFTTTTASQKSDNNDQNEGQIFVVSSGHVDIQRQGKRPQMIVDDKDMDIASTMRQQPESAIQSGIKPAPCQMKGECFTTGPQSSPTIYMTSAYPPAPPVQDTIVLSSTIASPTEPSRRARISFEEVTTDVYFIPNPNVEDNRYGDSDDEKFLEALSSRRETESPSDILFVTGKNYDFDAESEKVQKSKRTMKNENTSAKKVKPRVTLNCTNLDCPHTVKTVCGFKTENTQRWFRIFQNDCYFRKVNCAFKYEMNRYTLVPMEQCYNNIPSRQMSSAYSFTPRPLVISNRYAQKRRSADGSPVYRRSLNLDTNGQFCSHLCPVSCTDDYKPQCAVSDTGRHKVFANHCKMDYDSCSFSVVWNQRPLSECVGFKKADMSQNKGFIGWMQRVGIIDKKGRLVLE